jgi:hypothetical protein
MNQNTENPSVAEGSSTMELVGGVVKDTRDLVEAHVSAAKLEVKDELSQMAGSLKSAAISAVLLGVCSILVGLAGAEALVYFAAMPSWGAHAIVALIAAAIGVVFALRARKTNKDADGVPERQLARAAHDARWVAKRAGAAAQQRD